MQIQELDSKAAHYYAGVRHAIIQMIGKIIPENKKMIWENRKMISQESNLPENNTGKYIGFSYNTYFLRWKNATFNLECFTFECYSTHSAECMCFPRSFSTPMYGSVCGCPVCNDLYVHCILTVQCVTWKIIHILMYINVIFVCVSNPSSLSLPSPPLLIFSSVGPCTSSLVTTLHSEIN